MHDYLFNIFGMLIYSIPASLILLVGREWYLFNVMSKMGIFTDTHYIDKTKNPLITFDLWAFILLNYGGYSWGGLINREKKDTVISFIFAQLWFVIIIGIAFVFLHTKDLNKSSYMYIFLIEIIKKSWILHLINYIPIPPFDASFFYAQKSKMKNIVLLSKVIITFFVILLPLNNHFFSGQSFLNLLGLN